MKDTEIYRMEEIRDEMIELLDEARAITAGCDDYIIVDQASVWISSSERNINSENIYKLTAQRTINDLWKDYHDEK